jgi:hypothetical protein
VMGDDWECVDHSTAPSAAATSSPAATSRHLPMRAREYLRGASGIARHPGAGQGVRPRSSRYLTVGPCTVHLMSQARIAFILSTHHRLP